MFYECHEICTISECIGLHDRGADKPTTKQYLLLQLTTRTISRVSSNPRHQTSSIHQLLYTKAAKPARPPNQPLHHKRSDPNPVHTLQPAPNLAPQPGPELRRLDISLLGPHGTSTLGRASTGSAAGASTPAGQRLDAPRPRPEDDQTATRRRLGAASRHARTCRCVLGRRRLEGCVCLLDALRRCRGEEVEARSQTAPFFLLGLALGVLGSHLLELTAIHFLLCFRVDGGVWLGVRFRG